MEYLTQIAAGSILGLGIGYGLFLASMPPAIQLVDADVPIKPAVTEKDLLEM